MTREELEKEATEYALEWGTKSDGTYACCRDGYLAGAEPREKRIEELEHQLIHRNCVDCSNHSSKLKMRTLELEKKNAELEKEKDVIKRNADEAIANKLLITAKYNEILNILNQEKDNLQKENTELKAQIEKMQETLKSDLIIRLKENISYSTSPSCTKGMELFIKSIEEWEIKKND